MQFVLIPSRNHMKEKNGKAARPKYHVLFPVADYTDPTLYAAVKSAIQKKYDEHFRKYRQVLLPQT